MRFNPYCYCQSHNCNHCTTCLNLHRNPVLLHHKLSKRSEGHRHFTVRESSLEFRRPEGSRLDSCFAVSTTLFGYVLIYCQIYPNLQDSRLRIRVQTHPLFKVSVVHRDPYKAESFRTLMDRDQLD